MAPIEGKENYPLITVSRSNTFMEGFWWSAREPYYPFPKETSIQVNKGFVLRFYYLMRSHCTETTGTENIEYCKLCDMPMNNSEYVIQSKDTVFKFPSSLMHYYTEHRVHPSLEFYEFIMTYTQTTFVNDSAWLFYRKYNHTVAVTDEQSETVMTKDSQGQNEAHYLSTYGHAKKRMA
jgi:hypothetical protein